MWSATDTALSDKTPLLNATDTALSTEISLLNNIIIYYKHNRDRKGKAYYVLECVINASLTRLETSSYKNLAGMKIIIMVQRKKNEYCESFLYNN